MGFVVTDPASSKSFVPLEAFIKWYDMIVVKIKGDATFLTQQQEMS